MLRQPSARALAAWPLGRQKQPATKAPRAQPQHQDWLAPVPKQLSAAARGVQRKLHQTIAKITADFDGRWHFNTSISAIMELMNEVYAAEATKALPIPLLAGIQRNVVLLLAPFAPFIAAELWQTLGEPGNLLKQPWPSFDSILAKAEEVEIGVQVNGKLRGRITVPADSVEEFVRARALAEEKVKTAIGQKEVVKAIVVPGKLVNIVVRDNDLN